MEYNTVVCIFSSHYEILPQASVTESYDKNCPKERASIFQQSSRKFKQTAHLGIIQIVLDENKKNVTPI